MRALTVLLALLLAPACAVVARHTDAPRPKVRGPMPTRVQQPNKLTFLAFRPRSAATQAEGTERLRITSAYSSIFEHGDVVDERVVLDGELSQTSFALTWGLGPRTDLEVELSVLYATSGFLDDFVESWHGLLGLPDGGREEREPFTYEMTEEKDGQEIYHLEGNEAGLGDVPVVLTQSLVAETESTPSVAARAGVELPLGSESMGFGNGALDWGGGVLAQKSWGRWTMTGAVDYVFTRRPSSFVGTGVDVEDALDVQWGLEYRWNDVVSLLGGVVYDSPVTNDFRIEELAGAMASVGLGLAFDTGDASVLVVGFEDDALAESGPDFTAFASWSVGL